MPLTLPVSNTLTEIRLACLATPYAREPIVPAT